MIRIQTVNMFFFLLTSENKQIEQINGSVYQLSTLGSNTGGKEYILYTFFYKKKNSALVSKQVCRES